MSVCMPVPVSTCASAGACVCAGAGACVRVCGHIWRQELICVVYIHCRQLDKFKAGEVCNLVWGVAQLSPQADVDLLQQVLQASPTWSEVSTYALAPSITITHTRTCTLHSNYTHTDIHTHLHPPKQSHAHAAAFALSNLMTQSPLGRSEPSTHSQ